MAARSKGVLAIEFGQPVINMRNDVAELRWPLWSSRIRSRSPISSQMRGKSAVYLQRQAFWLDIDSIPETAFRGQ